MAYKGFEFGSNNTEKSENVVKLSADSDQIALPDASFVKDADLTRDGMDLVMEGPDGTIVIEGYFTAEPAPALTAPGGETLTPELVNSFVRGGSEFANAGTMTDESPVGAVDEISGEATVTRMDGTIETVSKGTPIYQGDVVETDAEGAVNIVFIDETSFAVSEDARLAIDEYVFDPSTNAGSQNFSVLKGVFVFTSGLIGREDPDDVEIDTPVGSIGIRGTIIAGDVDSGEITVVEGAIVLRDFGGNEVTLATQFETAKFNPDGNSIEMIGELSAGDVSQKYTSVSGVSPTLFSSINDVMNEQSGDDPADNLNDKQNSNEDIGTGAESVQETAPDAEPQSQPDAQPENQPVLNQKSGLEKPALGNSILETQTTKSINTQSNTAKGNGAADNSGANTATAGSSTQASTTPQTDNPPPSVFETSNTSTSAPTLSIDNVQIAPDVFFSAIEGQSFTYIFDKEFRTSDPNATITFDLTTDTVNDLNALRTISVLDGTRGTGIDSAAPAGEGWSFNTNNGHLELFFNTGFADQSVNFEILVNAGSVSTSQNYSVDVFQADVNATNGALVSNNNQDIAFDQDPNITSIGIGTLIDNNQIFMGDGDDSVTISTNVKDNTIFLGLGNNTLTMNLDSTNINNKIVGGLGKDSMGIGNVQNKFWGMDGDDVFIIDLAETSVMSALQTAGNTNTLIDGGSSDYNAGHDLSTTHGIQTAGHANGAGDTLQFENAGNIDFATIDDAYFKGIERLDFATNAVSNNINLGNNDVFNMTDGKNALTIRIDSGDTLTFDLQGETAQKVADNIQVDEGGGINTSSNFDVYHIGDVTLLVEDSGASITGLPA